MSTSFAFNLAPQLILIGSLLLVLSILASKISSRLGAPLLLVFLALGMLAGEDGLGHIRFDNYGTANLMGSIALAIILFDGGLRTHVATFRIGLRPALSLATLGVLVTMGVAGWFAAWLLDLPLLHGLLIGALVASTDAAAVFSLLHQHNLELKERIAASLEIESGTNDPMAVFLTVALVEMLLSGQVDSPLHLLGDLAWQMGLGALVGILGGWILARLINLLELEASLYPLLATAGGVLIYAGTQVLDGSGFLAVYLAGLILGNAHVKAEYQILRSNDGFAWLAQIGMFLMLGLLVTPKDLLPILGQAVLIALVLIFVARPLAVLLSLLPFRFPWRDQAFIAWVGLRGAVPIVLATFPLLAGLPYSRLYFNVVFVVVLVSLILQGWTIAIAARRLSVEVPPPLEPTRIVDLDLPGAINYELVRYELGTESLAVGQEVRRLPLPENVEVAGIVRGGHLRSGRKSGPLEPGDHVLLITPNRQIEPLNHLFAIPHRPTGLDQHAIFGDFSLNAAAKVQDVGVIYGFAVPAAEAEETLETYMTRRFKGKPVVGDRVYLRTVELTVREMEGGRISKVGVKIRPVPEEI